MNPFRESIVGNPWDTTGVDVPSIHDSVLQQCLAGIEHVRESRQSAGLLIHGETGSGKTHLLRRLRAKLTPSHPTATDRRESLYVWVQLQTHPRMIWRTVRRMLVDDWFKPIDGHKSQFDRILFHRLAEIRTADGDLEPWFEYMRDEHASDLKDLLYRIADNLQLDRDTAEAFQHLAFGRHRRSLRAWLSGSSLPEAELQSLGMTQKEDSDIEREAEAREVVLMLCRLAGNELPIVLSFDQVEALQSDSQDREALFAFGQLVSSLHDRTTNVLLLSSVQSSFASVLRDQARGADYSRMTSLGSRSLEPLTRGEAEQLIAARLANAVPPLITPPPTPSWPLQPEELDALLAGSLTPRRLFNICAERFDVWRRSPSQAVNPDLPPIAPPPEPVPPPVINHFKKRAEFLATTWDTLVTRKQSENREDRTDEIIRHGLPLVTAITTPDVPVVPSEMVPDVELVFQQGTNRTGVSLCTAANMTSLAGRLKRLKGQYSTSRLSRLVLLRDSRVPITKTAKAARQNLEDLEQQGAVVVYPSLEVLAAIDAIRSLLSDAKSGDLADGADVLSPQTVSDWLREHLADNVRDFVSEVLGTGQEPARDAHDTSTLEAVNLLLKEQPVVALDAASKTLDRKIPEIIALAQRHPDHIGLLGQPPTAMFRPGGGESMS